MSADPDAEFRVLLRRFEAVKDPSQDISQLLDEFAENFIQTLKAENDRTRWTALSEKFPERVLLHAMDPHNTIRKPLLRKLGLLGSDVSRWFLCLRLKQEDRELAKVQDDIRKGEKDKVYERIQLMKIKDVLRECRKLMWKMLREQDPTSIRDLRRALDETHEYALQLRLLGDGPLSEKNELIRRCFANQAAFDRFKEGIRAGVLQDRVDALVNKGEDAAAAREELEACITRHADELRERLLDQELLSEQVLEEYPLFVQYRVINEQQALLRSLVDERIRSGQRATRFLHPDITVEDRPGMTDDTRDRLRELKYLRCKAGELKEELGLPNEAESSVRLLMKLRQRLLNMRRSGGTSNPELVITAVRELPATIVVNAVISAEWNSQAQLTLEELFGGLPPHVYVRTLVREMDSIIYITPDRYFEQIRRFRDFVLDKHKWLVSAKRPRED